MKFIVDGSEDLFIAEKPGKVANGVLLRDDWLPGFCVGAVLTPMPELGLEEARLLELNPVAFGLLTLLNRLVPGVASPPNADEA